MGEVANRLGARPARWDVLKQVPGDLAELIRFAIAASHKEDEALVRQVGDRCFPRAGDNRVMGARILDRTVAPKLKVADRRREAPADVSEKVMVRRRRDRGDGMERVGTPVRRRPFLR